MAPVTVAVLDDYQGVSEPAFKNLDPSTFQVTTFKDTLPAFNHRLTTQEEKEKLVKRLEPFNIISTMRERTPFPGELVRKLPNLKLLLTTGQRNAALDLSAFKERSITVATVVDSGRASAIAADSTTQHCVAMILATARNIAGDDLSVKTGGWQTTPAMSLAGKTFGVVGLGRLGMKVSRIMHTAFDMRVIAWSTNLTQEKADEQSRVAGLPTELPTGEKTFKVVSREELFSSADVISVHMVLSDRSRGLITSKDLGLMKSSSIFVNTSRGPLVVEEDLLGLLEKGAIKAAAVDVFDREPLPQDSPWRTPKWGQDGRSQVLLTPHMGYVDGATLIFWYESQAKQIKAWKDGQTLNNILSA